MHYALKIINSTLLIINKERRLVMKKMLLSLIAITMLSTGTTFAQRRSGTRNFDQRTETYSNHRNQNQYNTPSKDSYRGNGGHGGATVHHGPVHHSPVHYGPVHHGPMHHRPMPVYHERVVVVEPAPVAYSYPCPPPPPPAPVVVVEPTPTTAAISIGALAGILIGGTIAAASR